MPDENFISKLWQEVLENANDRQASDIHIEPGEFSTLIRLRVDGVLFGYRQLSASWHKQFISHIKILSNLDIGEKRLPQDGRYQHTQSNQQRLDCRVSTIPTIYGEKIVIRLLNQFNSNVTIRDLGMSDWQEKQFLKALSAPQGLILITGPTGSGKTLSLYTCLHHLNDGTRNISTIEDPCEMEIPGINQIMTNAKSGLDFPTALRALLRQDPDVIMIGEIRDSVTAQIALQASQTGHLVLASLHTNNTIATITRMLKLGCEVDVLSDSLQLISAQRLIRKICIHCNANSIHNSERICSFCSGSRFHQRMAIHEVLPFGLTLRQKILEGSNYSELTNLAISVGMKTLYQSALQAIEDGHTTLNEIHHCLGQPA
jgi:type II secretory ATPase GspE/PulE/Tfp pilus assembly ATPase PilB-like protein